MKTSRKHIENAAQTLQPASLSNSSAPNSPVGMAGLSKAERAIQQKAIDLLPQIPGRPIRITGIDLWPVQPRWLFLKISTDAGISGIGEATLEGHCDAVMAAIQQLKPELIGQDARLITFHWHGIYRHAFYRGGPVLQSALSGIDIALWDIAGKALGVPIYQLLGGPTRSRIRVYAHVRNPTDVRAARKKGFRAFKTLLPKRRPFRQVESTGHIAFAVEQFAQLREAVGKDMDLAIDFHGAVSPTTARLLLQALEPHAPLFVEEPCPPEAVAELAALRQSTSLPIAAGERVYTKWGFRDLLERGAVDIVQPDLCHAGGISECRLIAGLAETFHAVVAPHCPLGPIALAASLQLAASIPNFLIQEVVSLGEGYLKKPFTVEEGFINLPAGPGLGIELDEEAIQSKLGHQWRNPQVYDPDDGSVTGW